MNKMIRKSVVAVAALLAIGIVPVAAQTSNHAWGGFGDWPVSSRLGHR
ncbi:MAG: hypothetical protein QM711_14245 [Micropruina sp.]